jgi:hypothetical protein
VKSQELHKDYGYVYEDFDLGDIKSIVFTMDNKYLFTSNTTGHVKQFSIKDEILWKDHGKLFDSEINSVNFSSDS